MKWRTLLLLTVVLGLLGAVATFYTQRHHLLPETSPTQRGQLVAERAGCMACHAMPGAAGVRNPLLRSAGEGEEAPHGQVPDFWEGPTEVEGLRQWITNGVSNAKADSEALRAARERQLLEMPAYGDALTDEELADLLVWIRLTQRAIRAEAQLDPAAPTGGEQLARSHGCFTCHGELGQGGVRNPGSFKGYVPGFFGMDFRIMTREGARDEIRQWIRDGVSEWFVTQGALGIEPARHFTEQQVIQMPAYQDRLTDEELEILVDYCLELNRRGPLDLAGLNAYSQDHALPATPESGPDEPDEGPDLPTVREISFVQEIKPVLERACVGCHGPNEWKSRYRLDRPDLAFAGGDVARTSGVPAITPRQPDRSLLVLYLEATEEDPLADPELYPMPPPRADEQLTAEERSLLRTWVEQGAMWPPEVTLSAPE